MEIANYKAHNLIYSGNNSDVYTGTNKQDGKAVILKFLKADNAFSGLQKFSYEFEITKRISAKHTPEAYELIRSGTNYVIAMEFCEGKTLDKLIRENISLSDKIRIALAVCEALQAIHEHNVIHKDINPANIIIADDFSSAKIIDFGISTQLSREVPSVQSFDNFEGTLNYVSPEQTGRMNRPIDYRADLYSLGITLYELFTGKLPFLQKDLLEIVHAHIAQTPPAPSESNTSIPRIISDIILKLIAKNAEDRYQSLYGLRYDFEYCLANIDDIFSLDDYQIATKDQIGKFQIPSKLYGRENEIKQILAAYDLVLDGQTALVTVAGFSGIGKSALVNEVHKPLSKDKGYFISGKYDQFQRNIPYSSIIQAFRELIRQILTEPEERIEIWRKKIQKALGENGEVITSIIPELESIIGKQMPLAMLGPTENKNRFLYVFQNFTRVFAQREHPLVIFLDDLQWADVSSLELIKTLLLQENNTLFFIIAYRDNEVDASHPLMTMLRAAEEAGVNHKKIFLQNLPFEVVNQIISDTLHTADTEDLCKVVYERTSGNPFFVTEFLNFLYKEYFINFDKNLGKWKWDTKKITTANLTNNVVELILSKLKKLSPKTQDVLRFAACIGNRFDLQTLSVICAESNLSQSLWEAMQEGIILPLDENYKFLEQSDAETANAGFRFLHDRVQQAAYALIETEKITALHIQIGLLLKKNMTEQEQDAEIFDLLNHLNYALNEIREADFREELAKMNFTAGKKAYDAAAYASAISYLSTAIEFLPKNAWEAHYELRLNIANLYVSAHLLDGKPDKAIAYADEALEKLQDILHGIFIITTKVESYATLSEFVKAVDIATEILAELGVDFNPNPGPEDVGAELGKTLEMLSKVNIPDLENLPVISDPKMSAALMIIPNIFLPSYVSRPMLFPVLNCKNIQIMLEYGNTPICAFLYSMYAQVHWALLGTQGVPAALEFGELALKVHEKFGVKAVACGVYEQMAIALDFYSESFKKSVENFEKSYHFGFETGQIIFTNLSYMHACNAMFYDGYDLEKTAEVSASCMQWKRKMSIPDVTMTIGLLNAIARLSTINSDYANEVVERVNYPEMLKTIYDIKNYSEAVLCNFANLLANYYLEEYEAAVSEAKNIEPLLASLGGTFYYCVARIYIALAYLAVYTDKTDEEKKEIDGKLQGITDEMNYWVTTSKLSFGAYHALIKGETARVKGENPTDWYDEAIAYAEKAGQTNLEALANELAGKYFASKNKSKIAGVYLTEAYKLYQIWGADKKATNLQEKHNLAEKSKRSNLSQTLMGGTTKGTISASLDLGSLMKAANAITGELSLGNLLKSIMLVMIENSGASGGAFLLLEENGWTVRATGDLQTSKAINEPVKNYGGIPHSVFNLGVRTQKEVVLDNALSSNFDTDDYFVKNKVNSVLCLPIINKQKLVAVLYLENQSVKGVFSQDRLELLKLLSAQVATSIENAYLYANLEQKVEERTEQLNEAFNDIKASINYAQRIQNAILPEDQVVKEFLPDFFSVFLPKDVVSGDFYWFAHKKDENTDKVIIAVADCTGHGVPGAFMSMIGNSLLSQIIHDSEVHEPDAILSELHKGIRKALKQETTQNKDGMDMVLCALDMKSKTLSYAGANNPLIYIQNGELFQIKGTKFGIGGEQTGAERIYQKHVVDVSVPTSFYLITDGYQDQFGGKEKRKFMISRMKEMFLSIHNQPADEQKRIIEDTIKIWKTEGNEKQTDDITVVGFRIV
jgi:predicted ATPase/serine phosphatase RsbU (regulator of sigma subunit)/predicted Ser/Thr protein kinase